MAPTFLIKASYSVKTELKIALSIVLFLTFMPIMGVFALTHAKSIKQASGIYYVSSYPGDYYAWGNCTWWTAMRRDQIGEPIPNSWGNAATWAYYAALDGYKVDHTPSYGAIMQISDVDGGLGHVAFVENVNLNGTWHISEMNVLGLDVVDYKTEPPAAAINFNFIHEKIN